MRTVEGKVAVVTGGASGIGLAMGQRFGQAGMKVVLADVLPDRLDEAVKLLRDEGL
ncbi:MAG: SDR family NAD(P)-dependent oxidoreductase, partial [Actinobacteria bacterium]|nr:SDR family NAD(P)-dependent oxidoreductase [Actinomycetota bacterium]